jgi:hypothetical protein
MREGSNAITVPPGATILAKEHGQHADISPQFHQGHSGTDKLAQGMISSREISPYLSSAVR